MLKTGLLILATALPAAAAAPNLEMDDKALIHHLETTDRTLKRAVGSCFEQKIERTRVEGIMRFHYTAFCEIKEEQEGECHSYKVAASGVIENSSSAVAQKIELELLCSKEGD